MKVNIFQLWTEEPDFEHRKCSCKAPALFSVNLVSQFSRSVMSDSLWPHGLQPTRLLHPWGFPGKSTRVGCHCLLRYQCTEFCKYHTYWNRAGETGLITETIQKLVSFLKSVCRYKKHTFRHYEGTGHSSLAFALDLQTHCFVSMGNTAHPSHWGRFLMGRWLPAPQR